MTYNKLPGIYFSETVTSIATDLDSSDVLTFIVQTSTEISSIDNKLTHFDSFDAFSTIATDKGLPKTLQFINDVLAATGHTEFYVYSVKTDTADGFKAAINSSSQYEENQKFIYFEETKSAQANGISAKSLSLATACHECYEFGSFRIAYVVPYGTIMDAVTNKAEGVTNESAVVTAFTSILTGSGDSRLVMILPDGYSAMMSTIINVGYNVDAGYPVVSGDVGTLLFDFTRAQMLTLQNLGVCFLRRERVNRVDEYHVNLGVTTAFKSNTADQLLVARSIVDELLRQIKIRVRPFVLDKEMESNVAFVQTAVDEVVNEFVVNGDVLLAGTVLTVVDAGNMTFNITGSVQTIKSIVAINVDTTIS